MSEAIEEILSSPLCYNFDEYLPWACKQLQIYINFIITKGYQCGYEGSQSDRSKLKDKTKTKFYLSDDQVNNECTSIIKSPTVVKINTVYDNTENLVQLKFENNTEIPRMVLKIIGLILQFQPTLTKITINRGLNKLGIHEINKWLSSSNITDICLDNTVIDGANYEILLENESTLTYLSLSRCRIDDDVLKKIASQLAYPLPGSKKLTILVLSSNEITDTGVKYLAEALRTNRQLAYLNLSGNFITDEGSKAILDVLTDFYVTNEEIISTKCRRMAFLKDKNEFVSQIIMEPHTDSFYHGGKQNKPNETFQTIRPGNSRTRINNVNNEETTVTNVDNDKSTESLWYNKAKTIAENKIGEFIDPFSSKNVYVKDGQKYCYGNNNLAYLNLSYNDLSYITVKNLLKVLINQKFLGRNPRGLVNVSIEGNCIPVICTELTEIDRILNSNLGLNSRNQGKKRKQSILNIQST